MTTIAVYEGWLVADGRYTDSSAVLDDDCQKIINDRKDGLILTGAGDGSSLEIFMRGDIWDTCEWLPGGGPVFPKDQWKSTGLDEIYGWVYPPGSKYIYQSGKRGFDPLPIRGGPPQAIGSGSHYFKGAIHALVAQRTAGNLSMSTRKMVLAAMDSAIKSDICSGGKVTILRLT